MTDETDRARWAPDPTARHELRYWDGSSWTDHVSDSGIQGVDALTADSSTPAPGPNDVVAQSSTVPTSDPAANSTPVAAETAPLTEPVQTLAPTEQFVLTIGDIGVSPHWVVTPGGNAPLVESVWLVRDMSRTERKIPTWAIVLAVVFAIACLLGLLFLLAKEDRTTGYVEVTVTAPTLHWMTQVPVWSDAQIARVRQDVAHAQSLAAVAKR